MTSRGNDQEKWCVFSSCFSRGRSAALGDEGSAEGFPNDEARFIHNVYELKHERFTSPMTVIHDHVFFLPPRRHGA